MSVAIQVENLHICYKTMNAVSVKSFFAHAKRNERFEAIKGISFQVEHGEILGVIGQNGGGKSTLLRAVAGIFSPDAGKIDLFGQSVSLLAIGVGFQPLLTGRTNIELSGLLLGYNHEEIMSRMDEIIQFAELGDFIDKPVRTYSSGMYSKLAFAITATLESDITLVDEVLSVGDARFKQKSFNRMRELISDEDRTVMFVSHDMSMIQTLCHRVLWIEKGEMRMIGDTQEVVEAYNEFIATNGAKR